MKVLIAVLFGASLWAQEVNNAFTLEKERVLGKQIAADIRQQSTPFGNPVVDAYLQRVGNTLTSRIPDEAHAYTFEAVITRQVRVDPIPLPGGHILIPINFLLSVQDEAEFTCMLGHSIAHIALRHGFLSRRGPGSTPLVFVASHTDPQQLLIPKGLWGTQRNNELDADKFGLELAARSGYDPSACRRYVERTQPPIPPIGRCRHGSCGSKKWTNFSTPCPSRHFRQAMSSCKCRRRFVQQWGEPRRLVRPPCAARSRAKVGPMTSSQDENEPGTHPVG